MRVKCQPFAVHHLAHIHLLRFPAFDAFLAMTLEYQPIEAAAPTTSDVCLFTSIRRLHQLTATRSYCIEFKSEGTICLAVVHYLTLALEGAAPSDAYRGYSFKISSGEVGRSYITEVMKLTIGLLWHGIPLR
jgi:hypothetical protein